MYTIQLASRISGVGVHTIRAWEKRYKAVTPQRNKSGRRVYTEGEIERLSMLSELCSLGHSIGHVAKWPTEDLKENLKKLGRIENKSSQETSIVNNTSTDTRESLDNLLLALEMYKLDIISHEFNKLKLVLTPRQFVFDIIQPLMYELGRSIKKGELSLSQEQAIISLIRFHMGALIFKQVQYKSKKPYSIILTTPEGESDEMVILLSALLCAHYNLNIFYLGSELPLRAVLEAAKSINSTHIILGVNPSLDAKSNFLNQYVRKLLENIPKDQKVILRGSAQVDVNSLRQYENFSKSESLRDLDQYLKNL